MFRKKFPYICIILFVSFAWEFARGSEEESRLMRDLLKNYDVLSRPVENFSQPLNVKVGLEIYQLIHVDEKRQRITTNNLLRIFWTDTNLKWNKSEYSNISVVRIPPTRVWRPDIRLFNKATDEAIAAFDGVNVLAFHSGDILQVPAMVVKSTCRMDVTWFPFDRQECTLNFGSWTYSNNEINLQLYNNGTVDLHGFLQNGEWELLKVATERHAKIYECCSEEYVSIIFTLHLKRRSFYYFFNLLVPCALIGFLAILGFTLPPDSGEKLSLGVTVLFSLIVFLNTITQSMPANSDAVPLLGTYFNCVMMMIALSVVSTIVVNLNQRATRIKAIEGRSRALFLSWLPWILRMRPPSSSTGPEVSKIPKNKKSQAVDPMVKMVAGGNILGGVDFRNDRDDGIIKQEWKFVAIVVDRICLLVSLLFTAIATAVLLVSSL